MNKCSYQILLREQAETRDEAWWMIFIDLRKPLIAWEY